MKLNTMGCKSSLCFAIYWMERRVTSLLSGIVGIDKSALALLLPLFHREREIMESIVNAAWLVAVTTQARQEIRIWCGLIQRHMGVRGRTVT
jgi:hypothetical protein